MKRSLREEIENAIDDALEDIDIDYEISFTPSSNDGENSCFTVEIDPDSTYDDFYEDVEDAIDNSGICSDYDLSYFWDDEDFCLCTNGWDY